MENSDDQFSLKWNNFQSNLATGFHDLLQEEDMVDVTLAAEGKFLQAHKIILSVCSPYFKDLFKANPCKHPIVILKDVGHQELADMLDFMYRGEASVRQEDLAAFLKLAETLKVKGLAGDKGSDENAVSTHQTQRKPLLVPKKKKVVETTVFEPEDDPGDPDFSPSEPKRKRKRVGSPVPKTENASASATNNSFVPLTNPKQEVQEHDEVEFLDDTANDSLVQFITGKQGKSEDGNNDFEDSNQELTGDETHDGDLDMTAGPSNADDTTDQVPQENLSTNESRESQFKESFPEESVMQLLLSKEEFSLPRECSFPTTTTTTAAVAATTVTTTTATTVNRTKMDQPFKQENPPPFQMPSPCPVTPGNFFPTNFVPRQRSQSNEFRPPHDFSNPIWEYFTLEDDKASCKVCGKRITYRNNAYVTNLVTHLRTRGIGHDTCYNFYMMKKSETSSKVRDEIALNYLLTNMASTVFGSSQQQPQQPPHQQHPQQPPHHHHHHHPPHHQQQQSHQQLQPHQRTLGESPAE